MLERWTRSSTNFARCWGLCAWFSGHSGASNTASAVLSSQSLVYSSVVLWAWVKSWIYLGVGRLHHPTSNNNLTEFLLCFIQLRRQGSIGRTRSKRINDLIMTIRKGSCFPSPFGLGKKDWYQLLGSWCLLSPSWRLFLGVAECSLISPDWLTEKQVSPSALQTPPCFIRRRSNPLQFWRTTLAKEYNWASRQEIQFPRWLRSMSTRTQSSLKFLAYKTRAEAPTQVEPAIPILTNRGVRMRTAHRDREAQNLI